MAYKLSKKHVKEKLQDLKLHAYKLVELFSSRYTKAKQLGKYSGKKLLIMITDGRPQYHHDGNAFSEQVLVNLAVKEYRKGQKYCKNIMCININPNEKEERKEIIKNIVGENIADAILRKAMDKFINQEPDNTCKGNLKRIFKKNYVEFPGMNKASEFVLKSFRKAVTSTLRS